MASASVTMRSLGKCGPQWPSTSAEEPEKFPGARTDGTKALGTAPTQVASDIVVQRSPTKKVLLVPSRMSAMLYELPDTNIPPCCRSVELSSTPSLPLQAT